MSITLSFLGRFQALQDGQPATFATNTARALLAYLAVEAAQPRSRAYLAALLWPDQPQTTAYANLRQTLLRVRQGFASTGASQRVLAITPRTIQFLHANAMVDVVQFRALLATVAAHQHADLLSCSACIAQLQQAVAMYHGGFLHELAVDQSDLFTTWLHATRETLHQQALDVFHTLAQHAAQAGHYRAMDQYAMRQLALEPWREAAHAQRMHALWADGQRAAAIAQYETCRQVLHAEFGIAPSRTTQALYQRILGTAEEPGSAAPFALVRHNLPTALTPLVGRKRELADVLRLLHLPSTRLLTLTGMGGMGKTRLAFAAAHASVDAFPDGVFWVNLAPLTTTQAIVPAIASALGIQLHGGDTLKALGAALRDKHMLVVLDNFEHLLDDAALVLELIQPTARVQIIITSREPLRVRGEQVYRIEALAYDPDALLATAALLPAVELFVQSAQRAKPSFTLNEHTLPAVLHICHLVQGMPLGVELAAAWAASLPLDVIVQEIARSGDFLHDERRDASERHRSMRAVFEWSWALLGPAEQHALMQLSVFRGSFSFEAARAIATITPQVLARLVHASLLHLQDGASTGRYAMHELLRQFAAERLAALPAVRVEAETRHGAFFLALVAQHGFQIVRDTPWQSAEAIRTEIDHVRQAWRWAASQLRLEDLERSAFAVWAFHTVADNVTEAEPLFAYAAACIDSRLHHAANNDQQWTEHAQRVLSVLLAAHASCLLPRGKNEQVLVLAEQALTFARQTHNAPVEAWCYLMQGQARRRQGQSAAAHDLLVQAAQLARHERLGGASHDILAEVEWRSYNWLCSIALTDDQFDQAQQHAEAGVTLCRSLGKRIGTLACLSDRIDILVAKGRYQAAGYECEQVFQLASDAGYARGTRSAQFLWALAARLQGEYGVAYATAQQGRVACQQAGDYVLGSYQVNCLAYLHLAMGDLAGAQTWLDQYEQLMHAVDMPAREVFLGLLPRALVCHAIGDADRACAYAEQAWHMAQEVEGRSGQGNALVTLGIAYEGANRPADASHSYTQALALYTTPGHDHLAAEALAGLARIALDRGDRAAAHTHAEQLWRILVRHPRPGINTPFDSYLACYRAFAAAADPRADVVAQMANDLLQTYAASIHTAELRQSFLERVPTHRELRAIQISHADAILEIGSPANVANRIGLLKRGKRS